MKSEMSDTDAEALNRIADQCNQTAEEHGWHQEDLEGEVILRALKAKYDEDGDPECEYLYKKFKDRQRITHGVDIPAQLMLIVTEAAEAMEDLRNPNMINPCGMMTADKTSTVGHRSPGEEYYDEDAKPIGVGSEAADIVIRTFNLCRRAKIDIVSEIRRKMAYNASRPFRHGGKRI